MNFTFNKSLLRTDSLNKNTDTARPYPLPDPPRPSPSPAIPNRENWSSSLQNLLDQPPANFPLRALLAGMLFFTAFGTWAWLGQIEEVGQARGQLQPKGEVYKIHPLDLGKVASLKVKEGDTVKTGQVLLELDTELARDEVRRLQEMLSSYQMELSQKQTLMEGMRLEASSRSTTAKADMQAQEYALAQAREKAHTLDTLLLQLDKDAAADRERVQRLQPLSSTNQELQQQLQADLDAAQERVGRLAPLVKEGAVAKELMFQAEQALRDRQAAITRNQLQETTSISEQLFQAQASLSDRQRSISQTQGERQQALQEADRLRSELQRKQAEAKTVELQGQQQIEQMQVELTQLRAKISETRTLLETAKAKLKQRFLFSPVNGVVSSLNVANPGEVVQPGQTIAELAPADAPLVLSAVLPNQEAGLVTLDMPVKVKFDAFPYQDYGVINGKVISISPDAKPDQKLGTVYRLEVRLDRNYVNHKQEIIRFKAGQTATADIVIRQRRIADLLLDPIRQLQKGGLSL